VHYWSFNNKDWIYNCRLYDVRGKYAYVAMLALYMDREAPLPSDVAWIARHVELPGETDLIQQILDDHYRETKKGWTMPYAEEQLGKINSKRERAQNAAEHRSKSARDKRSGATKIGTNIGTEIGDNAATNIGTEIGNYPITQEPNNPVTQKPKNPRTQKTNKPETQENISAPVGAASAEPPPCVSGSLTLEEAQEIVAHYAEVRPNVIRFKDGRTGEPMTDLVWAATLLWFWDKSRAAQFGIESNPAEAPKEQPKVTIMDTRAAGKVKVERPEDCDEQVWKDWMRVRGRNALTETAWGAMLGEARKAGITPAEAVRVCAERGWRGFRADWVNRDKVSRPGRREEVDIAAIWGRKPTYEKEA
jgi:uncharacterized protein YdaU (DUF1376 family)